MLVRMCDFGLDVIISDLTLLAIAALGHIVNATLMLMGRVLSVTVGIYRFGLERETPQMHNSDIVQAQTLSHRTCKVGFFQEVARTMGLPCVTSHQLNVVHVVGIYAWNGWVLRDRQFAMYRQPPTMKNHNNTNESVLGQK